MPDVDELRLLRNDLLEGPDAPESLIDEDEALAVFHDTLARLEGAGLVVTTQYDMERIQSGHRVAGSGTRNGSGATEYIREYRFTVLRSLNGIPVANNGIRIGIHASGKVSSLRLGGVAIESHVDGRGHELPVHPGWSMPRTVSREQVRARFDDMFSSLSTAHVDFEGVMYVLPRGAPPAVVEPVYFYRFSRPQSVDGVAGAGRQERVAFSLRDPAAPVITFSTTSDGTESAEGMRAP